MTCLHNLIDCQWVYHVRSRRFLSEDFVDLGHEHVLLYLQAFDYILKKRKFGKRLEDLIISWSKNVWRNQKDWRVLTKISISLIWLQLQEIILNGKLLKNKQTTLSLSSSQLAFLSTSAMAICSPFSKSMLRMWMIFSMTASDKLLWCLISCSDCSAKLWRFRSAMLETANLLSAKNSRYFG